MWGDEKGFVSLLWFLKPLKGLFEIPFSNQKGPHRLYMQVCMADMLAYLAYFYLYTCLNQLHSRLSELY